MKPVDIGTERLVLRRWRPADRQPFAALNADARVMEYFSAVLNREESDALAKQIDEHFELIYRKTACLFSVCMKLGGILAGASAADLQRLADYGRNLGMAFQIVDDVLDLTASEEVLGKPVASDLREGKATLAVLHALERCDSSERATIASVLGDGGFNGITPADIVAILKRHGSIDAAYARATEFANTAREAICTFPDSEIKRVLLWVPEFVVERQS